MEFSPLINYINNASWTSVEKTTTVTSGSSEVVTLSPNADEAWVVFFAGGEVGNINGSSGEHTISMYPDSITPDRRKYYQLSGDNGGFASIRPAEVFSGTLDRPANFDRIQSQSPFVTGQGITFEYDNQTDVDNTDQSRFFEVFRAVIEQ